MISATHVLCPRDTRQNGSSGPCLQPVIFLRLELACLQFYAIDVIVRWETFYCKWMVYMCFTIIYKQFFHYNSSSFYFLLIKVAGSVSEKSCWLCLYYLKKIHRGILPICQSCWFIPENMFGEYLAHTEEVNTGWWGVWARQRWIHYFNHCTKHFLKNLWWIAQEIWMSIIFPT